jgi:type I restriction enzyme R subunit
LGNPCHDPYTHADPASALVKLRLFAENLTKDIYRDLRLPKPDQPTFVEKGAWR